MKLFVTADIHSFYYPFIEALAEAGFDKDSPEHWLIVCGDCFDRGPDSVELLHYLMSLERKILVKGNHDLLLEECCLREFPYSHDFSNGTVKTIEAIGEVNKGFTFEECCQNTWNKLAAYRSLLVNYFETENYIFVHSWIPTITYGKSKPWYIHDRTYEYLENWRTSSKADWEEAMWDNPFFNTKAGLNKTGKTIVFGHWHCSTGHSISSGGELSEFGTNACWDIYKNEDWKIISLDKCTAYTGKVNVLVIEDNFLNLEKEGI